MSSPSLIETIKPFIESLSPKDTPVAHRAVGRFALLGEVLVYNEIVKQLSVKDVREIFLTHVKQTLKTLPTVPGIWRATFYAVRKAIPWADAAPKFGVTEKDIEFCWGGLQQADKAAVKEAASGLMTFERLAPKILIDMVSELDKFCASVAYKRLRFLQTTDHAVGLEDLKNDLLAHALLAIRKYEHFSDDGKNHNVTKIKNYVKRSITNHALNLINYYTSKGRARIENITVHCGQCAYCKEGKFTHCQNTVNDFRATTVSLDAATDPAKKVTQKITCEDSTDMIDILAWDRLYENADPSVVQYIDIITEKNIPEEFEPWLQTNYKLTFEGLDTRKLGQFAAYYCGLDETYLREIFAEKLKGDK